MSTMTETLKHEEALFIPSEDTERDEYVPMVEGEYLGHITETRTITREFTKDKRPMKARIFNFKVVIAPENTHNNYTLHRNGHDPRTVTGEHYVGKTVVADGVFRFLEPTDGDTHESNAEGNKRYLMFCKSIGMEIPTEERVINGTSVTVQLLPDVKEDDLDGVPVTAVVGRGQDWTDDKGQNRPSWRVKFTKVWTDGKRLATTTTNDLPF
jgi:hypothetical protein|tara:strand:+ start:61 stop:693 length:633 start_codon:yes stop_codon:yes gene_type:complete